MPASAASRPSADEEYLRTFDPVDYDPRAWARLARQAGMKYAVLTAKHHEGFCLFDSAYTDYKATNTPAGRDLVREYVDAFRAEGLRVGLYYSLVDWHHPDYPAYNDPFHPMRGTDVRREERCDFSRYLDYMHAQVRELCTNYGKLDLLWFDFSYDGHCGEDWRAGELVEMVRTLQPGILLNSRLEASGGSLGSLLSGAPTPWAGDFATPEQILPPAPLCRPDGTPVCWEACQTMNNSFGYTAADRCFKTARTCIRQLVECVSKGGNYLLNVGPDARGNIPPQSRRILCEIGEWMRLNADSIYGCGASAIPVAAFGCPRHRPRQKPLSPRHGAARGAAGAHRAFARRHPIRTCARNRRRGGHPDKRLGRAELSPNCVSQPGSAGQRNAPPAG